MAEREVANRQVAGEGRSERQDQQGRLQAPGRSAPKGAPRSPRMGARAGPRQARGSASSATWRRTCQSLASAA
eukprot:8302957-Pyramimonas_sp.AAC.1